MFFFLFKAQSLCTIPLMAGLIVLLLVLLRSAVAVDSLGFDEGGSAQINVSCPSTIVPSCNLYGTLSLPNHSHTLVLFLAGSGPTDRDGNSNGLPGIKLDMYKMIGDGLNQAGIATLRFDKLGAGEASNCLGMRNVSKISVEDEVEDAIAVLKAGLALAPRAFKRIHVLGHSEGSTQGMMLAEKLNANADSSQKIKAYISLSGPAYNIHDILITQINQEFGQFPEICNQTKYVLDELLAGRTVPQDKIPTETAIASLFSPINQIYLISWMKYNPSEYLKNLKVDRVLIVQGTTDIQVSFDNGRALAAARPDAVYDEIDKMSHTLKFANSTSPADQVDSYQKSGVPLHPKLVPSILEFLFKP